jgi:hypothetical protein
MANNHQFRNICGLWWQTTDGPRTGTGFLVGPRHVLTVAHNLFDPQLGGKSQNLFARFPGSVDGAEHTIAATDWNPTDQWRDIDSLSPDRGLSAFDFGLVILSEEPEGGALRTQTFNLAVATGAETVALAGYPSFAVVLPNFTNLAASASPLFASAHPAFGGRLFYEGTFANLDNMKGMSGCPVWPVDATGHPQTGPDGRAFAVGIQTSVHNLGDNLASGVAITSGIIALVQQLLPH